MQISYKKAIAALSGFYLCAAALGFVMWRLSLPDSFLIILVVPVLLASIFYARPIYLAAAIGALIISLITMRFTQTSGITRENYQTVFILFLTVSIVAEVIYQIVNRLKRTQRRLLQSESRFRLLVENAPDAIIVLVEEKVRFVNPAAKEMLGLNGIDDVKSINGIELVHPDDRERARKRSLGVLRGEMDDELDDYRLLRKDGKTVEVEAVAMPIEFEDQVGLQVVMRDVTERNRTLRERQVLDAQMRQTQKLESLGVLAGGIAHEFNNILVGIMGNAQLLLNDIPKDNPKRKHYVTIIDAAHRATGLCTQMRAYAGDDQGQSVIALDISKEVLHIEKLLNVIGINSVDLRLELQDNLPRVKMDPAQLRQILITLVTNAVEAIGANKGHISVSTGKMECDAKFLQQSEINEELPPGTYVFLRITDTGCGMPEEVQERIFDPFYTTKFAGRGLGLASVVGMVRASQGCIRVKSKVGKGSEFTVLLPAAQGHSPDSKEAYHYDPEIVLKGTGKVLLVDDDPALCRYTKQVLERSGFIVIISHEPEEALRIYAEDSSKIKALFLNLSMDGVENIERWKELSNENPELPIVLLASEGDGHFKEKYFPNVPNVITLAKPFKRRDILLALKNVMSTPND